MDLPENLIELQDEYGYIQTKYLYLRLQKDFLIVRKTAFHWGCIFLVSLF